MGLQSTGITERFQEPSHIVPSYKLRMGLCIHVGLYLEQDRRVRFKGDLHRLTHHLPARRGKVTAFFVKQ